MGLIRIIVLFLVLSASQAAAQLITRAQLVPLSNYVATMQLGSAVLSNLVGTVGRTVTNFVSLSTTNATSKPLTNSYTAGVLTMFGIEQGSGQALTMSSNIVIANDWAQTASTTNVVGVSNWINSVSNLVATKQHGTAALTNIAGLSSTVFTNVPLGGTNISVRTAGGTNFIDTTGQLNNWALYTTNVWNSRQGGSSLLTNWQGTGVLTNIVNGSTNWPAGQVGLLGPTNNGDVRVKSLSAGANVTLTDQGTNISIASAGGSGSLATNANQFGEQVTLTIKDYPYLTNVTAWATSRLANVIVTNKALVRAGQSTSNANVGGIMWFDTGNYTNCCGTTTLTNMNQFTVPAHTLTNNGDSLRWWIAGRTAFALASTNNIAVVFGSQDVLNTGLQIRSNCQWTATGTITRTGNTSQRIESTLWWPGPGAASIITNMVTDIAQTNGINTVLKVQGASRRVAVLTNMLFKVAYEPASL